MLRDVARTQAVRDAEELAKQGVKGEVNDESAEEQPNLHVAANLAEVFCTMLVGKVELSRITDESGELLTVWDEELMAEVLSMYMDDKGGSTKEQPTPVINEEKLLEVEAVLDAEVAADEALTSPTTS